MQPNRLERVWKFLQPEILNHWKQLTPADLQECQFKFDRVVEAIRKAYSPGRSHLTLEAEIRDWLDERIESHEKAN